MAIGIRILFKNPREDLLFIFGTISDIMLKILEYLHFSVYPD